MSLLAIYAIFTLSVAITGSLATNGVLEHETVETQKKSYCRKETR